MLLKKRDPKDNYEYSWWGYLHINGNVQVKRYYSPEQLLDAEDSPFVKIIVYPFNAINRESAELIIIKKLEDEQTRKRRRFKTIGGSSIDDSRNRKFSNYGLEA